MKIIIPDGLTIKERNAFLVKNAAEIIDLKKSATKECDDVITPEQFKTADKSVSNKEYLYENDEEKGIIKRTIVGNTYLWLDTHDDVHLLNLFAKSVAERGTKIPHLRDHVFQLEAKVGKFTSIKEQDISWKELGVNASGSTMALIAESEIKRRLNEKVFDAYLNDEVDQHSVGMQYVKVALAIDDKDYKEEFKLWKSLIDLIGNSEKATKQGYFWAVSEAKLREISAVLLGSNELTPTLGNKFQPAKATEKKEPVKTTLDFDRLVSSYTKSLTKN